jgi:hypothetical protein
MQEREKKEFTEMLAGVFEIHGRDLKETTTRIWWRLMRRYTLDQFSEAIGNLVATSKFLPKPSEVIEQISGRWMDANEAWAAFPKDESETGAVNQAMRASWGASEALFYSGDTVGARMAFKAAYERYVKSAVLRGETEQFELSIGWDAEKRENGIRAAVNQKLITQDQAKKHIRLLPAMDGGPIAGLLTGGDPKHDDEKILEKLKEIKAVIDGARDRRAEAAAKAREEEVESMSKQREELERIKEAYSNTQDQ